MENAASKPARLIEFRRKLSPRLVANFDRKCAWCFDKDLRPKTIFAPNAGGTTSLVRTRFRVRVPVALPKIYEGHSSMDRARKVFHQFLSALFELFAIMGGVKQ